jgi:hypothetical protein
MLAMSQWTFSAASFYFSLVYLTEGKAAYKLKMAFVPCSTFYLFCALYTPQERDTVFSIIVILKNLFC